MKKGEKGILIIMAVAIAGGLAYKSLSVPKSTEPDKGIPYYSNASSELETKASTLMRELNCRDCHKYHGAFGGITSLVQNVPAPPLDGIGSLRTEQWLFEYFSAEKPQSILPSRLKEEFKMPSYAALSEQERRLLASYLASLKVEDWYLQDTKKMEYEKLTGKTYKP
jgi:hypothetical protein